MREEEEEEDEVKDEAEDASYSTIILTQEGLGSQDRSLCSVQMSQGM